MRAAPLWPADVKIIEFGCELRPYGQDLIRSGCERYLGVVTSESLQRRLVQQHAELTDRLVVSDARQCVRRNNADVLLLHGSAAWSALRFRNLRHARFVAFPWRFDLRLLMAWLACLVHVLLRRCGMPKHVCLMTTSSRPTRLLVFPVRRRRPVSGARHYVPHRLGIQGLLQQITRQGLRHAVLRWFESLPVLPPGEDLDLLVADEDVDRVFALLDEGPGLQPCDLYSVTGLTGSDFRGLAYFPPMLAESLLDHATMQAELCRVPSRWHHFLSLAYHALYHKGPSSGLPQRGAEGCPSEGPEQDYASLLKRLAEQLQIQVEITREGLETYLMEHGWRPPLDMLRRLAKRNRWIQESLRQPATDRDHVGLAVFLLRQEAMNRGGLDRLTELLERCGFSVLMTKVIANHDQKRVAGNIRGGNWGRGPWAVSGGPPAAVVVVDDPTPLPLTWWQKRRFPLVDNARILDKQRIRDAYNQGLPPDRHCNVLHSSDNGSEAWEYISIAMPESQAEIRQRLDSWRVAYRTQQPVLKNLTRYGARAKVELIEHQGRPAVLKTFKPGRERFCQREQFAMRELSRQIPEVPSLLDADTSSVTCPFYDDVLCYQRSSGRLIPLSVAKQAMAALRKVHDAGFALLDAGIDNVVVDRHEGLKLIDFEFLHRYEQPQPAFDEGFDIAGCPDQFDGDLPSGGGKNYRQHWQPYVGLSLQSLLRDPVFLQHAKRCAYVLTHVHRFLPRRIRCIWRKLVATVRRTFWDSKNSTSSNHLPQHTATSHCRAA